MKHLFLAIALFFSANLFAQGDKNFIDQNYIEVTGKAEMEIIPDMIYIKVLLSEKDLKNRMTLAEAEQRMVQKLREIGIDVNKDVTIKDFSGGLRARVFSKDVALDKDYRILVRDSKTAAKVFSELDKLEISNISIDKLDNSKMDDYRRDVKIKAIKVAKAKAEGLTEAIGQKIGRAIYISEVQTNIYPAQANIPNRAYKQKTEAEFEDFNFENLRVDATILVRFELK